MRVTSNELVSQPILGRFTQETRQTKTGEYARRAAPTGSQRCGAQACRRTKSDEQRHKEKKNLSLLVRLVIPALFSTAAALAVRQH